MVELSNRLLTIASFVRPGSRIADVGTDHGFLPIHLIEQGIAVHAVAMDIRKGPLSRAQEHIAEAGLEKQIETRLGNGLEKLQPGEADTVIIAGMGGPLMLDILRAGSRVTPSVERFVLSPQSDWRGFRLGLEELGMRVCRETMVFEDGKYYVIMEVIHEDGTAVHGDRIIENGEERGIISERADRSSADENGRELTLRFGHDLLKEKNPVLRDYLLWQEGILTGILHKLTESNKPEVDRRRAEVEADLRYVSAALQRM
ncbi:MAG: SAM-dependent methyltransferase [Lachnospiraceae bacterium]|nr:SAM-dependent methyltransferase [Lachnospiraceae bacterium]